MVESAAHALATKSAGMAKYKVRSPLTTVFETVLDILPWFDCIVSSIDEGAPTFVCSSQRSVAAWHRCLQGVSSLLPHRAFPHLNLSLLGNPVRKLNTTLTSILLMKPSSAAASKVFAA